MAKGRFELSVAADAYVRDEDSGRTGFERVRLRASGKSVPQYTHPSNLITRYYVDYLATHLQHRIDKRVVVCDVGGGNGLMLKGIVRELHERGFKRVRGVLVELPAAGNSGAAAKAGLGLPNNDTSITTVAGDAADLDSLLGPRSMHAIVGRNFLHYNSATDQAAIVVAMRRTLVRGGCVSLLQPVYRKQAVELVHKACMAVVSGASGPTFAERLVSNCYLSLPQYRHLFRECGFRRIHGGEIGDQWLDADAYLRRWSIEGSSAPYRIVLNALVSGLHERRRQYRVVGDVRMHRGRSREAVSSLRCRHIWLRGVA